MEFSSVLATQSNSKSGEDVSQRIEPEWFVEKSAVKTDIQVGKDHKLVCVGEYVGKMSSFFNVCFISYKKS